MHDVFHVSQLKKCFRVPTEEAPLGTINVLKVGQNRDLTGSNAIKQIDPSTTKMLYVVKESFGKVRIFEEAERRTRHRAIEFLSSVVKPFRGQSYLEVGKPSSCELPLFLPRLSQISGRDFCKGGRFCNSPNLRLCYKCEKMSIN